MKALCCLLFLACAPRSGSPAIVIGSTAHAPMGPPIAVWKDGDALVVLPLRSGTLSLVQGGVERPMPAGRNALPRALSEVRWRGAVSGARYVVRQDLVVPPAAFVPILPHRLGDGSIIDEALRIR